MAPSERAVHDGGMTYDLQDALAHASGAVPHPHDVHAVCAALVAEGYVVHPVARDLLAVLLGRTLVGRTPPPGRQPDPVVFDPIGAAGGELDRVSAWARALGESLTPLAEVGLDVLCITGAGVLVLGRPGEVTVLGPDLAAGLRWLLRHEGIPVDRIAR